MHRQIAGKLTGRVTKWIVLVFWILAVGVYSAALATFHFFGSWISYAAPVIWPVHFTVSQPLNGTSVRVDCSCSAVAKASS